MVSVSTYAHTPYKYTDMYHTYNIINVYICTYTIPLELLDVHPVTTILVD